MRFFDEGIIIEIRPSSEKRFFIKVFSKENGCIKGVTHKKVDLGQRIFFDYSVKNHDQLGFIKIHQNVVLLFAFSLSPFVASTCQLLSQFLCEQSPDPLLYDHVFMLFSEKLMQSKGFYIWFEERLLQHLGFELSLETCAVTYTKHDLIYVSPKTGDQSTSNQR